MKGRLRFMGFLTIAAGLMMVFSPLLSWAEESEKRDYQEYTLGEIVVSGKGSAIRDIGIIDQVTAEEFEAVNADSVADALTYVPGVQVTYGRKYFSSINIHGFDQNRILTMIDGVPYYETKYGGLDMNQVSLEAVSRIDVVKGAPSVLYGPNALGGVVNIITKIPTEKPHFSITAEYGASGLDDAAKVSMSHGRKVGKFNYWLSYAHRQWDSWDVSGDYDPVLGNIVGKAGGTSINNIYIEDGGERLNSDYETDNFWAKLGLEPSDDTKIYVNYHYIKTEKGSPPDIHSARVMPGRNFSQLARIPAYDDWGIDLSAEHSFTDRFNLQGKIYYHNHEDSYRSYNYDFAYATTSRLLRLTDDWNLLSSYKDYIFGGMLLGDYKIADCDTLRFSAHYKKDSHEQRALDTIPFYESIAYTGSFGFENELSAFNGRLSIVAGFSYDWYDVTDAQDDPNDDGNIIALETPGEMDDFNPMIGFTYQATDTVDLFGSIARKTRFPTLDQIYTGNSPNLDLKSENAVNYTAGVRWKHSDLLGMEVAPFFHDISDYITRDQPAAVNPLGQYQNFDEIEMAGVEINTEITPSKNVLLKLGYMYDNASNKSANRVTDEVRNVPEYMFNFSTQVIVPNFKTKFNLTMLYVGPSYYQLPTPDSPNDPVIKNKSYDICNLKITQPFVSNHMEVFLAVNNMFDKDYEPGYGVPASGRSVWLGVTYKF